MKKPSIKALFSHAAQFTSRSLGGPLATAFALGTIVLWAVTGPYFHFSDSWQLVLNTGTSIVTFLMVFLIQNTQNRENAAVQMKLDELIRVTEDARNQLVQAETLTDEEIEAIREGFLTVAREGGTGKIALEQARASLQEAERDIDDAQDRIDDAQDLIEASRRGGGVTVAAGKQG